MIHNNLLYKIDATMTKVECYNHLPEVARNLSCHLNRTSKGFGSFSIQFALTEDVKDATGIYVVSIKRGPSYTNYTAIELDYCQALAALQTHFLLKIVADEIRRTSNFPLKCPFKKNKRYYIDDFTMDTGLLPSYVPDLHYKSDCQININKKKALELIVQGRVFRRRSGR
ncbi:hypothetical protein KR009_009272 [Drosophila setifemur]|nr:hypothetical protein KR009_009272 [Drosophila setifemur]